MRDCQRANLITLTLSLLLGIPGVSLAQTGAPAQASEGTSPLVPKVEVHGGMSLYLYQPTNGPQGQMFVYANVKLDASWDWAGIYFEPRMSSEKMRSYYDSLAWIQQAYVYAKLPEFGLKLGKLYKRVGLSWDHSFYGNIQVYEGLKFDPNLGASLESRFGDKSGVGFIGQYFYWDGHLNASLLGRDTVSYSGARRRNTVVLRVEPYLQLSRKARLELGLSGETFTASFPDSEQQVARAAADVTLTVGRFGLWGEALGQWGAHVPVSSGDVQSPGEGSSHNVYLLAGAEVKLGPFTPRYNLSIANYLDTNIREVLHLPGLSFDLSSHFTFFAEFAVWDRAVRGAHGLYDESVNLTAQGFF